MGKAANFAHDGLGSAGRGRSCRKKVGQGDLDRGAQSLVTFDDFVDQAYAQRARRVEPATARKERASVRLADLGNHERRDDGRQYAQPRLGETEFRAGFCNDQVRHRAQAHPAAECRAVNPGNHRSGTTIDGIEHLGHDHCILLVLIACEPQAGAHPADVRTRAERRAGAAQDNGTQGVGRLIRETEEHSAQVADERCVECVVHVRPVERYPRDSAVRSAAFHAHHFALGHGTSIAPLTRSESNHWTARVSVTEDRCVSGAIVSDMDGTLSTAETWRGVQAWVEANHPSRAARRFVLTQMPFIALARSGIYDKEAFRARWLRNHARLLRGVSEERLRAMGDWVVDQHLWPARRSAAIDALGVAIANARRSDSAVTVVLASGAYLPVAQAFAARVGADIAMGTPLEVREGVATGRLADAVPTGRLKASAVRERIGDAPVLVAFGDTAADIPMLEMADHPVAVAPDKGLQQVALERGWELLDAA